MGDELLRERQAREARALDKARQDYAAHLGKLLRVEVIFGYRADDNSHEIHLRTPALVRVTETPDSDVARICDDCVDPYWNVEVVEPGPDVPSDLRSAWLCPWSYRLADGERENDNPCFEVVRRSRVK